MNGFELAELMRGTARTKHMPIVFVSAAGKELELRLQGLRERRRRLPATSRWTRYAVKSKVQVFVDLYRQRTELRRQLVALEESRRRQQALVAELQTAQIELKRALQMRDDFMSMVVARAAHAAERARYWRRACASTSWRADNTAFFAPENLPSHVRARPAPDPQPHAPDRRHARRLADPARQAVDPARPVRPRRAGCARVVDELQGQAAAAGRPSAAAPPATLEGVWDEFRIEQVVVNLLTNALRYGGGKPVRSTCSWTRPGRGRRARPRQRPRRGHRARRTTRASSSSSCASATACARRGLGLGLYITAARRGPRRQISVDSTLGEGSLFSVRLPMASSPESDAGLPPRM